MVLVPDVLLTAMLSIFLFLVLCAALVLADSEWDEPWNDAD